MLSACYSRSRRRSAGKAGREEKKLGSCRWWCALGLIQILLAIGGARQSRASDEILANPNRTAAGKLENGGLTIHLEIVNGTRHAEAEDEPAPAR
jgi:hypothetical protein